MEDQTSWKGHTFTLLVFTGIAVLCSIFFILGMLVGRAQGQKIASTDAPVVLKTEAQPAKEDKPDFTFYDSVKKESTAALEPAPARVDPPVVSDPPAKSISKAEPPRTVTSRPENVINYQIGAVKKAADAEKLLDGAKKKGFRGFIIAPAADDPKPFFRVQVGPFKDPIDAQETKKKLESAGYQPILKK